MYICLCNGLTDRAIRSAARGCEHSVSEVYRALGCAPRCGKCAPDIREMLRDRDAASPSPA